MVVQLLFFCPITFVRCRKMRKFAHSFNLQTVNRMQKAGKMVIYLLGCTLMLSCSVLKGNKTVAVENESAVAVSPDTVAQVAQVVESQPTQASAPTKKPVVVGYNDEVQGSLDGGTYVRRVLYRESEVTPKPQFRGGDAAYKKYLAQNVKYPQEAMKKKIQGSVRVGFTVNPDGSIVNAKVERKVNPLLDNEALRVVKSMPKWIPGKLNGEPVPVKMYVPVNFRMRTVKK